MKKFFTKIIVFPIFFLANPVFAQDEPPTLEGNIGPIVDKITGYLFPVAVLISLVFVVMGGYMWIISGGDPSRVKQAQGTLTWAILGLVIVLVIFGILRIVINFLS
ncbi:MAG: TrbC/VirB2 family protein [Candidatus Dojkabacteria bacterium]|jgi:amino acid transporter